jgi:hypothetical protein
MGVGLLREKVGANVVKTRCKNSHSEATVAMVANKRQGEAALRHVVLAVADIWGRWRVLIFNLKSC